jgi:hypothetical protein
MSEEIKYNPSDNYLFECEVLASGLYSSEIEESLGKTLQSLIKDNKIKAAVLSNENTEPSERTTKIFSILEEVQWLINGKILHIGRVPSAWKDELLAEMDRKKELTEKRKLHIDDCIMMLVEKQKQVKAVIFNRKAIYCISEKPPR